MPPSPALRCSPSPGREMKGTNHRRGRSFEGGLLFREKDDDLALFNEMQTRERENFLLTADDIEDTFCNLLYRPWFCNLDTCDLKSLDFFVQFALANNAAFCSLNLNCCVQLQN